MSIVCSAGEDPATVSIRQYCLDGSYSYMETTLGPVALASLISDLTREWTRMQQHIQWKERQTAKSASFNQRKEHA